MSARAQSVSSIGTANVVVTTAATPVQLSATSVPVAWVIVTAAPANTGNIVVGDENVVALADAERGATLAAGDPLTLPVLDLSLVHIDATVSGDEVGILYGVE